MNHSEEKLPGEDNTFGNLEYMNFGKYKGQTVYEVANIGDKGYLQWVSKKIKLREDSSNHLQCVLDHWDKKGQWIEETGTVDNVTQTQYVKMDMTNNEKTAEGPKISKLNCVGCDRPKTENQFESGSPICKYCAMTLKTKSRNMNFASKSPYNKH
jgi:hypothetical protein